MVSIYLYVYLSLNYANTAGLIYLKFYTKLTNMFKINISLFRTLHIVKIAATFYNGMTTMSRSLKVNK